MVPAPDDGPYRDGVGHFPVFAARHRFAREIFYDELWNDWTEQQLRTPPHDTMNSLAWIVWHVARVEDAGVSRFVLDDEQLLHVGGWNTELGLDAVHFGYGCTRDDMLDISASVDLDAARRYLDAVGARTIEGLDTLDPERLDQVLTSDEIHHALQIEGIAPSDEVADATVDTYAGWSRLEALYHFSMTHYYWHGGEVRTIEGVMMSHG